MEIPRKKKCSICHRVFRPDPRVAKRQRACSAEACQAERRRQTQASWRARNPRYAAEDRLKRRVATAQAAARRELDATGEPIQCPPPRWVPPELRSISWQLAVDEIGLAAADFLAWTATTVLALAKDERRGGRLCSSVFSAHLDDSS